MKAGYKLNKVIFKLREGDKAGKPNECSIGGKWIEKSTDDFFKNKRVVLFSLPGAFTPTCSASHLPRYEALYDAFREAGIDDVICLSVNDAFVMSAWGDACGVGDKVDMLSDGNGEMAAALGLELDASGGGLGIRIQRFAAIVEDGVPPNLLYLVRAPGGK